MRLLGLPRSLSVYILIRYNIKVKKTSIEPHLSETENKVVKGGCRRFMMEKFTVHDAR